MNPAVAPPGPVQRMVTGAPAPACSALAAEGGLSMPGSGHSHGVPAVLYSTPESSYTL